MEDNSPKDQDSTGGGFNQEEDSNKTPDEQVSSGKKQKGNSGSI